MKRRAFLGFLGGAAASGPKLAASLVESAGSVPPMPGFYGGMTTATADPSWVASRIADLKKIISGKDPQEKRNRTMQALYHLETLERHRLDSLRAVSGQHKARMLMSGSFERQKRIRKADAEFDLADLMEIKLPF